MNPRESILRWGLAVATAPAVLFFPAVAMLAICPPDYGPLATTVILITLIVVEVAAASKLAPLVARPIDWVVAAAVAGLILVLLVFAGVTWGLVAPALARRAGY